MRRLLTTAAIGLALAAALILLIHFLLPFLAPNNGYLSISSTLPGTKIFLNTKEVGTAPYRGDGLKVGIYKLGLQAKFATGSSKLFANRAVSWSDQIPLDSNVLTVVNVDFGPSDLFTAVEILSLRKGTTSFSLATQPTGAKVDLDGKALGSSPLVKDVKAGVHRIKVSQDGYLSREMDVNVPNDYQTVIQITLSANPLTKTSGKLSSSGVVSLYDLSSNVSDLLKKPELWAEGIWFFQEKTPSLETKFDCLVDFGGKLYYYDEASFKAAFASGKALNVGYLGKASEKGLSAAAQKAWDSLHPTTKLSQVEILSTPTGTLNVRDGPSQSNKILTTVKPGEKYDLTGEQSGWYKIKVGNVEGWISSQYAKKL